MWRVKHIITIAPGLSGSIFQLSAVLWNGKPAAPHESLYESVRRKKE